MNKSIPSIGYTVYFERDLRSLGAFITDGDYSRVLVFVDRNTHEHCLPVLQSLVPELAERDIIEVDPGEESKNIDFCVGVWKTMLDFGVDRRALLVNLGGGVVTDMGGFAASTFKRGIDFVQIPTTLLAQVDASVGGKTGIDLDNVKNIIGTFAQPKAVFICPEFLKTLDDRQLRSGFAEVVKHGLIFDKSLFDAVKSLDLNRLGQRNWSDIVFRSVSIKNAIVTQDPTEKGLRKILNFGHTIGHAVEGYSLLHDADPLLHGEAIAIGMVCEAYLAHRVNGLSGEDLQEAVSVFTNGFEGYRLDPKMYPDLIERMQNDKKNESDKLGFALLREIGKCDYNMYVDRELVFESLDFYTDNLRRQTKNK